MYALMTCRVTAGLSATRWNASQYLHTMITVLRRQDDEKSILTTEIDNREVRSVLSINFLDTP